MGLFPLLFLLFFSSPTEGQNDSSPVEINGRRVINLGNQKYGYFQGDLKIPEVRHRNGILATRRWPDGIIYYLFGTDYPTRYYNMVIRAMRNIEKQTCIRFRQRVDEPDYVNIYNSSGGCYSEGVGRTGGEQVVSLMVGLKTTCFTHAIVVHELLHAVGLWHEQMRYDRDDHIIVHWENVDEDAIGQFQIIPESQSSVYNLPYDYKSVMHYDAYAFGSEKGKVTMEPVDINFLKVIGKAKDASERDWEKVRQVYECGSPEDNGPAAPQMALQTPPPCVDKLSACKFHSKQCSNKKIRAFCRKTCKNC